MALIGMAVYCTEENKKDDYLFKTLESLEDTVDFDSNRLILSVNGYTKRTKEIIENFSEPNSITGPTIRDIIWNDTNLGTAEALNLVWRKREENENAIKIDDDIVIKQGGWIEDMEEAIRRDNKIGQVGLKRKDCWENPDHENPFYKSELSMLPHNPGEKWIIVEKVNHVMGSCVMHSSSLLNKVGYLYQIGLYGFDDSFMSLRSRLAGFYNCFLPHVEIEHIDKGDTPYQKWKEKVSSSVWEEYHKTVKGYNDGTLSLYYNPFNK